MSAEHATTPEKRKQDFEIGIRKAFEETNVYSDKDSPVEFRSLNGAVKELGRWLQNLFERRLP